MGAGLAEQGEPLLSPDTSSTYGSVQGEELAYDPLGTPPKGEICLRGPIIFQGYYEDKKKTEEAFGVPLP